MQHKEQKRLKKSLQKQLLIYMILIALIPALFLLFWYFNYVRSSDPEIATDSSGIFVTRNDYDANGIPLVRFSMELRSEIPGDCA